MVNFNTTMNEMKTFICTFDFAKKSIAMLMLFVLSFAANAQTFYEVTYTDPDDEEEYTGLMIYYSDEDCKMRLVNKKALENDEVFESAYYPVVEGKESKSDVGVMVYAPEKEGFPAFVWMWEKDDASDINSQPFVTFDIEDPSTYFEAEYFVEITLNDMNEEYILQFYGENEDEYKMMMEGMKLLARQYSASTDGAPLKYGIEDNVEPGEGGNTLEDSATPAAQSSSTGNKATMHLIVLANTNVSDIGVACHRDAMNVYSEMEGIARVLGMNFHKNILTDQYYSKENLSKAINQLSPSKDDVVVFVYSGHGFRFDDQTDFYPNMDVSPTIYDSPLDNYVAVSDVYNAIIGKGARLNLVFSDCCNVKAGVDTPSIVNNNTLFSRSNSNFDMEKLRKLFLQSRGSLIATAASPGEASWCGVNGSYFILSVLEQLRNQISVLNNNQPSWDMLVSEAIESAANKTANDTQCKKQNGMKMVDIK